MKSENRKLERRGHIATVLLQDYFHRGVFKHLIGEKQWNRFEGRLDKNVEDTLSLLDRYNVKATFFTLGWIADHNPEIISRITSEGHEIGCAGYWARSVREMTPTQFREDLRRSVKALESAGANKIIGYRCAYQWFQKRDLWALTVLAEEGFLYDASYRPALIWNRQQTENKYVLKHQTKTGKIWEFPTPTHPVFGFNIPIGGGSYLRLFPYYFMFKFFKYWCESTNSPFVLYFHPWELDKSQPQITAVGRFSKLKQYRNLGKLEWLLPNYFEEGYFQTVAQYLGKPLEHQHESYPKVDSYERKQYDLQNHFSSERHSENSNLTHVSVVIPCYNESASLPFLAKALEELIIEGEKKYHFQFLFVDDKSTDDTFTKLRDIFGNRKDCRIIQHEENRGVASALHTGLISAKSEIVCTIDADCSYDPLELVKMIPLIGEDVAMVTASPYHKEGFVDGVPRWRLFLSKSLSKIYEIILQNKLSTYTSCFRVHKRSAIINYDFNYSDFLGIAEMLATVDIHGGKIEEFPTTLHCRIFGQSKMTVLKTIIGHLKLIFKIVKKRRNDFVEKRVH